MQATLSPLKKWIAEDGGWRTGHVVEGTRCLSSRSLNALHHEVFGVVLVRESCDGRLTWVRESALEEMPMREVGE